jgi:hypothetical protein
MGNCGGCNKNKLNVPAIAKPSPSPVKSQAQYPSYSGPNNPDTVKHIESLAYITSAIRSLEFAKIAETCPNCQEHIQIAIDVALDVKKTGELGIAWDAGKEPTWKIIALTVNIMLSIIKAGVRRLVTKWKRNKQ